MASIADLRKIVSRNVAEILNECFASLKKLIFEGPKYLVPLTDFINRMDEKFLAIDPEKLSQTEPLERIFSTADLERHE